MQNQAYVFAIFILNGVLIGLLFDIFRIFRKSFKTPDIITYIEDILFWIFSGIILLYSIFKFNNGELRMFIFLGIILGITVYMLIFSKIFIKVLVHIINFIKKIFNIFILIPIKFAMKIINKVLYKPIIFICVNTTKFLKKIMSFFKINLRKVFFKHRNYKNKKDFA